MFKKWSHRLIAVSRGWVALTALLVFLLFTAWVLPAQSRGPGEGSAARRQPDTSLVYSAADLYEMAEAFGPTGRQAYIRARFTFDLIWPLIYGLFFITSIGWLANRAFAISDPGRLLVLVPVIGVVLDYLENIAAALVMARYPAPTPLLDGLAPVFTLFKWIFVVGSFVALVVVLAAALRARVRRPSEPASRGEA